MATAANVLLGNIRVIGAAIRPAQGTPDWAAGNNECQDRIKDQLVHQNPKHRWLLQFHRTHQYSIVKRRILSKFPDLRDSDIIICIVQRGFY